MEQSKLTSNTVKTNPFFQPADRVAGIKPYFFASLNQRIAELKKLGRDIIRVDIGSPDLPPDDFIINALVKSTQSPTAHGYSPIGGTLEFREAVAAYYHNRFGVELNPQTEVLGLIGSKEGLFNLSQILLNPGDVVLVPDPGYPVYSSSGQIAGAEIYKLPLFRENSFLPDLDSIPQKVLQRAKLLWLNYPNNPTGAIAPLAFFEKAVEFAHQHQIIIAHDAPYVDVCFDNYRAPSFLEIPGAKDVVIEFNSLSKTYNMAGWRLGMAVGNPLVIKSLHTYKSQIDTSHFGPILKAGTAALTGDQNWLKKRNKIYQQRRDIVVEGLKAAGFQVQIPLAAIYVWAHLPDAFADSIRYCSELLEETGVSATPGIVYGPHGEGYIRVSLCSEQTHLEEAMKRLATWTRSRK